MSYPIEQAPRNGSRCIVFFAHPQINPLNNELVRWDSEIEKWVNHLDMVLVVEPAWYDPPPADIEFEDEYVGADKPQPFYLKTRKEYLASLQEAE